MNPDAVDQAHTDTGEAAGQFLRLCLQGRWDPTILETARTWPARDNVDWNELVRDARRGGLGPLLYDLTRGRQLLPPEIERQLRRDYFGTAQRNVRLFHELEQVMSCFAEHEVPVILLKGAALARAVYGNVAVRPMCDVDLLVREDNVPAALRALNAMGYAVIPPRAYRCEVMLRHEERAKAPIELHWSLFVPFYYQHLISDDWLWETAPAIDVGETSARILGPEAQLLHLCGHLTLHHGIGDTVKALWLYDIAAVIDSYGKGLDWDVLLARARTYGLVLSLQRVLPRVNHLWRPPIPSCVLDRLDALQPSRHEKEAVAALTAPSRPASQSLLSELAALPGYGPRLRVVLRNLFPPPGYLQQIYALPHPLLVPLAYPYRWLKALLAVLQS